jgi:hypothetical protein
MELDRDSGEVLVGLSVEEAHIPRGRQSVHYDGLSALRA